jgi:5'-nucleotidase
MAAGLYAGMPLQGSKLKRKQLTVLHTNDFHSRLEPFPLNHPKYAGQGGIARLKTLIDRNRENGETLLLDCGDIFQGTPYFNRFGGVPELEWMNEAGYDAATLGNHDFDMGVQHLATMIAKHSLFRFVNCNYDFSGTALDGHIHRDTIIEKAGLRIGITGVGINPEGLIPSHLCEGIVYRDPVSAVQERTDTLKQSYNCDIVILLSHLGYAYDSPQIDDRKLAAATHGIDLILGGHTHTFLEEPVTLLNKKGKTVTVNQAGWAGLRLGKISLEK